MPLGEDQMDLGRVPLQPAHRVAEHICRRHLLEPEQAPELDGAIGLLRGDLERDVVEHAAKPRKVRAGASPSRPIA